MQIYYNGSTQKKKIVMSQRDGYSIYNVKIQEWDSSQYGFVTRQTTNCKELIVSKKAKAYSTSQFALGRKPFTEYYISSGIKVLRSTEGIIHIKQVGEK